MARASTPLHPLPALPPQRQQKRTPAPARASPQRLPDVGHEAQVGVEAGQEAQAPGALHIVNKTFDGRLFALPQLVQQLREGRVGRGAQVSGVLSGVTLWRARHSPCTTDGHQPPRPDLPRPGRHLAVEAVGNQLLHVATRHLAGIRAQEPAAQGPAQLVRSWVAGRTAPAVYTCLLGTVQACPERHRFQKAQQGGHGASRRQLGGRAPAAQELLEAEHVAQL